MNEGSVREGDVVLRPWRWADAAAVARACQDEQIWRWTLVPRPYRPEDAETFVGCAEERSASGCPGFAAVDAATGDLLGSFGVVGPSDEEGPEVGYWLAPWARGRGVGTSALRALCRWLFDEGAPRIRWKAEVGNLASLRTAEAVGFTVEGTARQALPSRRPEGGRADAWTASLLPGELRDAGAGPVPTSAVLRGWPTGPVVITTRRLRLRPFVDADTPSVLALARDLAVDSANAVPVADLEQARQKARTWADSTAGTHLSFAVTDTGDGAVLGHLSLHAIEVQHASAELGYSLLTSARGRGVATEAVQALTDWVFTSLPLARLRIIHALDNKASCGVAHRAGFGLEGVTRRSYRYGDGRLRDEHLHARVVEAG